MSEFYGESDLGRPARRPILIAVGIVAIAALGLSGLYQGFRMTWRDYPPPPHYAQFASADATTSPNAEAPTAPPAEASRGRSPTSDARPSPTEPATAIIAEGPSLAMASPVTAGPPPATGTTDPDRSVDRDGLDKAPAAPPMADPAPPAEAGASPT